MSRPLFDIKEHLEEIDKLCALQATGEEIASFLDIDYDTLNRRLSQETGLSFTEYFEQKRGTGKISLRRKQFEKALGGDTVMLIWLGKQILGQADKMTVSAEVASDTDGMTPQQILESYEGKLKQYQKLIASK